MTVMTSLLTLWNKLCSIDRYAFRKDTIIIIIVDKIFDIDIDKAYEGH